MSVTRTTTRVLALALCLGGASAQDVAVPVPHKAKPAAAKAPSINTTLILLDPAHGGSDMGGTLPGNTAEKDVTLSLANHIRTLLTAKGFTVVMTRENSTDEVPADTRVELANRSRPLACILLHAASGGHGIHLYTSSLAPPTSATGPGDTQPIAPWDTAQGPSIPQSLRWSMTLPCR